MKIFVLLTIIAIGAVGAEFLEEGKMDFPFSRSEDYQNDDPNQPVNLQGQEIQASNLAGLLRHLPAETVSFEQSLITKPPIRNPSSINTILQVHLQLRRELKKAKIQQQSQRQLLSDIDNFIQLQIKSQKIQSLLLKKIKNLREVQAKRLDKSPKPIPQKSESELFQDFQA